MVSSACLHSGVTSCADTLGDMPPRLNLFTNRERANSFGGAAQNYDTYRPRYPDRLINDVLAPDAHRVLEAGAGTGIASMQMVERGADVVAVEPDTRMAAVAQAKGIPVELATFEEWDPAGRRFDRVVFAGHSTGWIRPWRCPKSAASSTTVGSWR